MFPAVACDGEYVICPQLAVAAGGQLRRPPAARQQPAADRAAAEQCHSSDGQSGGTPAAGRRIRATRRLVSGLVHRYRVSQNYPNMYFSTIISTALKLLKMWIPKFSEILIKRQS